MIRVNNPGAICDSWGNEVFSSEEHRDSVVAAESLDICRRVCGTDQPAAGGLLEAANDEADEILWDLIERTDALRAVIRLVCAEKIGACTVTDKDIAAEIRKAILAGVDSVADGRTYAAR